MRTLRTVVGEGRTVHQGYMPPRSVSPERTPPGGIWAMSDYVDIGGPSGRPFWGYGHYHEDYVKGSDGRWRIARLQLTRLRVDEL